MSNDHVIDPADIEAAAQRSKETNQKRIAAAAGDAGVGDELPEITVNGQEMMAEYGRLTFLTNKQNEIIKAYATRIRQLEAELNETVRVRDEAIAQLAGVVKPTKRTTGRLRSQNRPMTQKSGA